MSGNRVMLSRAITLVESKLHSDNLLAREIIEEVLPLSGNSYRIGITGVPGVGKSTFIETFGKILINENHKIAVLAIDPSSQKNRGSILGDKTRMETLSHRPEVFIRPSPSGTTLGGVASKTRETILLCEAAGFDIIIIETVGVGQSEVNVHGMVDFFLLLALAGAGDELQGIKKGIVEMADTIVINKADGANEKPAKKAQADFKNALHLFQKSANGWSPKVLTCSALQQTGITEVWGTIQSYMDQMHASGHFSNKRKHQALQWFEAQLQEELTTHFSRHPRILEEMPKLRNQILAGKIHPKKAASSLMQLFIGDM